MGARVAVVGGWCPGNGVGMWVWMPIGFGRVFGFGIIRILRFPFTSVPDYVSVFVEGGGFGVFDSEVLHEGEEPSSLLVSKCSDMEGVIAVMSCERLDNHRLSGEAREDGGL